MVRMRRTARVLLVAVLATTLAYPASAGAVAFQRVEAISHANGHAYIGGGSNYDGFASSSDDGGLTWGARVFPNRWVHTVAASSGGTSAMVSTGNPYDWMAESADGGVTWSEFSPWSGYSAGYRGLAYLGTRRLAVGDWNEYGFITSAEAGESWTERYKGPEYPASGDDPPPTTHAGFASLDVAPDGVTAWAVGSDWTGNVEYRQLVRKSTDGGSTWTTPTVPPNDQLITCVTAPSASNAYIARRNAYISRTLDGGANWKRSTSAIASGLYVNAIDAYDVNNVVIVGDSGKVYYSANAATTGNPTWVSKPTGTTNNLNGVVMLSATNWIVVGDNETILQTFDAGATWTGSKALGKPTVTITTPAADGFPVDSTTISVAGTSADPSNPVVTGRSGVGVAEVEVSLRRADGDYWNGSAWVGNETWLDASPTNPANGWDAWDADISIDATASVAEGVVISARSRDGLGQLSSVQTRKDFTQYSTTTTLKSTSITAGYGSSVSISGTLKPSAPAGEAGLVGRTVQLKKGSTVVKTATVETGGAFTFPSFVPDNVRTTYTAEFKPSDARYTPSSASVVVTPKAKVLTPSVSSAKKRANRSFSTWTYVYPKHTTGATGTTFYFYRYKRLSSGKYAYSYYKKLTAKATNSSDTTRSQYKLSVKLPAGKWRVRAVHSDTGHAKTETGFRYFRVY